MALTLFLAISITAQDPPVITRHPAGASVSLGVRVVLSVRASGEEPLHFQWRLNDRPLPGATNASLTLTNVSLAHDGDYTALVTNPQGTIVSEPARLEVDPTFIKLNPERLADKLVYAVTWADTDGDGDLDLLVTEFGQHHVLENLGQGTFKRASASHPLQAGSPGENSISIWADFDNDGLLDVYQTTGLGFAGGLQDRLFRNRGAGAFAAVANLPMHLAPTPTTGAAWGDFDNDGNVDLFVAHSGNNPNALYRNIGQGGFAKITDSPVTEISGNTNGGTWADYDDDGDLDLLVYAPRNSNLYENLGAGKFQISDDALLGDRIQGAAFADFDNDGDLDLLVTGNPMRLHRNDRGICPTTAWGDFDNDGFLDLAVGKGGSALYRNSGNPHAWLTLKLIGTRSNRAAIGAKVRLKATIKGQSFWQRRDITSTSGPSAGSDLRAHFGLGDATQAEILRVEWPSGQVTELSNVPTRQILTLTEPDLSPRLQASWVRGAIQLTLTGASGHTYHLEASHDLQTWSRVTSVIAGTGPALIEDTRAQVSSHRFYRAQLQ